MADNGDPSDKPGYLIVPMTGDPAIDTATLQAQEAIGYQFAAFYSVGVATNALLSRGYKQ